MMKITNPCFFVVLIASWVLPSASTAQTVYVSKNFEITMRTGPSSTHKIIALIQSGKSLDLVDKGTEWSMVRTPDGKEGWVLNRYLTSQKPCAMVLDQTRHERDTLREKLEDQQQTFDDLREQKKLTESQLSKIRKERDELSHAYEMLKKESSEYLNLRKQYQAMADDFEEEKSRSNKLYEENREMKRSRIIQWVITGGGIMLVGFFIGLYSSKGRRPRSSLY
jgi:SH3 domain protein